MLSQRFSLWPGQITSFVSTFSHFWSFSNITVMLWEISSSVWRARACEETTKNTTPIFFSSFSLHPAIALTSGSNWRVLEPLDSHKRTSQRLWLCDRTQHRHVALTGCSLLLPSATQPNAELSLQDTVKAAAPSKQQAKQASTPDVPNRPT